MLSDITVQYCHKLTSYYWTFSQASKRWKIHTNYPQYSQSEHSAVNALTYVKKLIAIITVTYGNVLLTYVRNWCLIYKTS